MKIAAEFLGLDCVWNIQHGDECTTLHALSERFF